MHSMNLVLWSVLLGFAVLSFLLSGSEPVRPLSSGEFERLRRSFIRAAEEATASHHEDLATNNNNQKEFIMWSDEETYDSYCLKHFLYNKTWGQEIAPFANKVRIKEILNEWNIPNLKIPKTITTFSKDNFTEFTRETMMEFPDPYIIKGSHTSGQVAAVRNGKFDCFKGCPEQSKGVISINEEEAFQKASNLVRSIIDTDYNVDMEPQYAFMEHMVVVEEHLDMDKFRDGAEWFVADGVPIFVTLQCTNKNQMGGVIKRNYYTEDFQPLEMNFTLAMFDHRCPGQLSKPRTWDTMRAIIHDLGRRLPRSMVRIDLYASEMEVYFSEIVYTTNRCIGSTKPAVGSGLELAVYTGIIDANSVTPKYVKETIEGTSWSYIPMYGFTLAHNESHSYPSPLDLCSAVYPDVTSDGRAQCIDQAKGIQNYPIRCITTRNDDDDGGSMITAIGTEKESTFWSVFVHSVEIDKVAILCLVAIFIFYYKIETIANNKIYRQYKTMILFLVLMSLYMYLFKDNQGYFSQNSFQGVMRDSFIAFHEVHPTSSPGLCISHFALYWFPIAACQSKSLRNFIIWMLCYELITATFDEFIHHYEDLNHVRCMRLTFLHKMKAYAFDEFIRQYIVPVAFVYGYLFPTFLWHWLFGQSIGHVVLFAVMCNIAAGFNFEDQTLFDIMPKESLD